MNLFKYRNAISMAVGTSVILSVGCASVAELQKVENFSSLANQVNGQLPEIANDIYRSCLRTAGYRAIPSIPEGTTPDADETTEKLDSLQRILSALQRTLESTLLNELGTAIENLESGVTSEGSLEGLSSDPLVTRQRQRKLCMESEGVGSKLLSVNSTSVLYMTKLGQVAGDDLTNLDAEFNQLSGSVETLGNNLTELLNLTGVNLSAENISQISTAGTNIAEFIVEAILDRKRRDLLSEVIPRENQNFQDLLRGMMVVIDRHYINIVLKNEEGALNGYYEAQIGDILDSDILNAENSVIEVGEALRKIDEMWGKYRDVLLTRREFAQSYLRLLQTVSAGHQTLANIFANDDIPTKEEITKILESHEIAFEDFMDRAEQLQLAKLAVK